MPVLEWYYVLLIGVGFALLLWFPQNAQHEGAHGIGALLVGCRMTEFKPYLHRGTDGKLKFASMRYDCGERALTRHQRALISAMPVAFNTTIMLGASAINAVGEDSIGSGLALGWVIVNAFDGGNNARLLLFTKAFGTSRSDLIKWARWTGQKETGAKIGAACWLAFGVACIVLNATLFR